MRKGLTMILAAMLCLLFVFGCAAFRGNALLPGKHGIASIQVSTMPHGYTATLSGADAEKLADYIAHLNVQAKMSEDPSVFTGMTWVMTMTYETGETVTLYLFADRFIRAEDGPWYLISEREAQGVVALLP